MGPELTFDTLTGSAANSLDFYNARVMIMDNGTQVGDW